MICRRQFLLVVTLVGAPFLPIIRANRFGSRKEQGRVEMTPDKKTPSERLFKVCHTAEDDERMHIEQVIAEGRNATANLDDDNNSNNNEALVPFNVNWRDPTTGMTCLLQAAIEGKVEVVQVLLEQDDIDVSVKTQGKKDAPSWSVAHLAARHGRHHVLQVLHQHGGINVTAWENGVTPLHRACTGMQKRHDETVRFFLQDLKLPWDLPAQENVPLDRIEKGQTCLDIALWHGNKRIPQLLAAFGAPALETVQSEL